MFIGAVVVLYEAFIALAQVGPKSWWVVPFQGRVPEMKLVLVVIREARKLLV